MVSLTVDGRVAYRGPVIDDAFSGTEEETVTELAEPEIDKEESTPAKPTGEDSAAKGKLIVAEEVQFGHVGRKARAFRVQVHRHTKDSRLTCSTVMLFFGGLGGPLFWFWYLSTSVIADILNAAQYWWLGWWAAQYTMRAPEDVSVA